MYEGMTPNHKKLLRIYRKENLRVRRRDGRKRVRGTRVPTVLPDRPNQHWSLDFISETLTCSRAAGVSASCAWSTTYPGMPNTGGRHIAIGRSGRAASRLWGAASTAPS